MGPFEIPKQLRLSLSCFLENDNGTPLPHITPTKLTEHAEIELVPTHNLHHYVLVSLMQKVLSRLLKEKHGHQVAIDLQPVCPARKLCWGHRICGSGQPIFSLT